jgi:8-oxo-dGTP diphosphatase
MITVTGGVLCIDGRILIARRPTHDTLARKWELPGGKVEDGESPEHCLARELQEELGVDVMVGAFLGENVHHYAHGLIRLLVYRTFWRSGRFEARFHDALRWVTVDELDDYDFAPADLPFIARIKRGEVSV